ncbi:MAG: hypothetical protein H7843_01900 [Nitrospirota bacterium]
MRYAASIPLTIKTPKGVLDIRAGQSFKVANNEFLLDLIKAGTVRPVRDILLSEFSEHTKRLSELPAVDINAIPELNTEIQAAIRQMNEAMENEDLSGFKTSMEIVESLYLKAVAMLRPDAVSVRVYSEVLGCYLWIVQSKDEAKTLRNSGVKETVYDFNEVRALKGSSPAHLKAVHTAKEVFPESRVEGSVDRKNKQNRGKGGVNEFIK